MKNIIKYITIGTTLLRTYLFAADSTKTDSNSPKNAISDRTSAYVDSFYSEMIDFYHQLQFLKEIYKICHPELSKELSPRIDTATKRLEAVFKDGPTMKEFEDFQKAFNELDSILKSNKK